MSNQRKQQDVTHNGERVSHLVRNDLFYAHLSIYRFALPYCLGKTVLDAGSGAGYGAAYLREQGAGFVEAVDNDPDAIEFSRMHFPKANLSFHLMSLQKLTGFRDQLFDTVFTSNALEHVPDLAPFFHSVCRLLKPSGALIIAVPPIVNERDRLANIENPFHLNIWSPRQWLHTLDLFFGAVQPFFHRFHHPEMMLDFRNSAENTRIDETNFLFDPVPVEHFYNNGTITAVFVAKAPRKAEVLPARNRSIPFIDDSFSRDPLSARIAQAGIVGWKACRLVRSEGWRALLRKIRSRFV